MKSLKTQLVVLLIPTLCLLTGALLAQQSPPSADTFVSGSTPKTNFGSSIILVVGPGTTTYMKFNLSGVPAGATVSKATLRLFLDAVVAGGQFDVYNLGATPTWAERTLTYNTPPPALGSSATGGHPITVATSGVNNFLLIDITATVQNWLANPSSNNGVALSAVGTPGYFSFESKEGIFTSHEPELEIALNGSGGAGSGTVTNVGSGLGLKGGPITTTGTLNIDTSIVPQLGATNNVFTGNISALSFIGNGIGLTNVNAASLNGIAGYNFPSLTASNNFVGNQTVTGNLTIAGIGNKLTVGGPSIFNMDITPGAAVTSNCLASAGASCTGFQFNGLASNTIFNALINNTPEMTVDAGGNMKLNGGVTSAGATLPALGTATAASAFNSNALNLVGSSFNGSSSNPEQVALVFEPLNNSSSPSGSLNLLFGQGSGPLTETGFSIGTGGVVNFVSGQTFGTTTATANNALSAANAASTAAANAATVAANAVPTAETYANGTFVPLAGGTMTGTLSVPTLSAGLSQQLKIKAGADLNATSGGSMELSAVGPMQLSASLIDFSSAQVVFLGSIFNVDGILTASSLQSGPVILQPSSATGAGDSSPLVFEGSSSNSSTNSLDRPFFQWQLEPTGNNTSNPAGTLNLLYGGDFNINSVPAETGLSIANNGVIKFAPAQTFPSTGGGTVTSVAVTPGGGLVASQNPITTTGTLNIDTTVLPQLGALTNTFAGNVTASSFTGNGALLTNVNALTLSGNPASAFVTTGSNTFTGNQNITGNLGLSGLLNLPVTAATSGTATTGVITLGGTNFAHAYGVNGLSSQNTFFGANAGNLTMTGETNIGIGAAALASNTSGQGNTAVGSPPPHAGNAGNRGGTLGSNTTGSGNTAMGSPHSGPAGNRGSGLGSNTTGSDNTSVGASALDSNTTGDNNVALGSLAGVTLAAPNANTSGSSNTFVGYDSGPGVSTEIDNATAIGANALVNCSNCMVLGDSTMPMLVGIGTNTPQSTLDVHGTGNFTGAVTFGFPSQTFPNTISAVTAGSGLVSSGSGNVNLSLASCPSGQVLASTGAGWGCSTVSGGGGGITGSGTVNSLPLFASATSVASSNVFQSTTNTNIGIGTATPQATLDVNGNINLPNTTSSSVGVLSLGGVPFLSNYPGTVFGDNTFVGTSAGNTSMTSGAIQNTVVGNSALTANTTGYDNSAFGFQALNANTSGNNNSAFGPSSLALNTVGNVNSAFGSGALGANKTGNANAAFGGSALGANESGSNNTAVGGAALGQLGSSTGTGGSTNIAIGFTAGYKLTGVESNNIDIGSQGVLGDSGTIRIGTVGTHTNAYIAGTLNVANLTVTGTCTGCGGGGGGGGTITGVTPGTGLTGGGTSGNVTLSLNPSATNTFTGTQTFNVPTGNGIVASTAGNSNAGISGTNTAATGAGVGVAGFTNSSLGSGVVGTNSSAATLGGGYGVQGLSYNAADAGVGGVNNSTAAGSAYGVFGQSLGSTGTGVYGTGNGSGVTGNALSPAGSGVVGTNFSTSGNAYGLYGQSSSPTGTGVYGTGNGTGVTGSTSSPTGYGVFATNTATSGGGNGVYGQTTTPLGTGVIGVNLQATTGYGVFGQSSNTGVYGTGNGSGVTGATSSPTGTGVVGVNSGGGNAGFFQGNVAVTGTLAIGGDTAMSSSPRLAWSGFLPGNLGSSPYGGALILDKAFTVIRVVTMANSWGGGCATPAIAGVFDLSGSGMDVYHMNLSETARITDSGPISLPVAANQELQLYSNAASGCSISGQSPSDVNVTVQYVMQ